MVSVIFYASVNNHNDANKCLIKETIYNKYEHKIYKIGCQNNIFIELRPKYIGLNLKFQVINRLSVFFYEFLCLNHLDDRWIIVSITYLLSYLQTWL